MIIREPPYDLVVLFADWDTKELISQVIERGQERKCIRPLRICLVHDTLRDSLCQQPEKSLGPYLRSSTETHFLMIWDRDGSGREDSPASDAEEEALAALHHRGISADRMHAMAIDPELEVLLVGACYERSKEILATYRRKPAPDDAAVFARTLKELERSHPKRQKPNDINEAMRICPKEMLKAVCFLLRLPYSPIVFGELGKSLSLPQLKNESIFDRLTSWLKQKFPPQENL